MVGGDLARLLAENKHDVVVIDQSKETCDRLYAETGVIAVYGNVAHIEAHKEAEVHKAEVVVAATGSDADNLACVVLARSLGVERIIARMRNPDYEKAYRVAGVDSLVRVTDLMVSQLMMDVEQPNVRRITAIGGGRASIFVVIVPQGAKAANSSVRDIAGRRGFPSQCVFVAAYNPESDTFAIPRGEQVIREGDELYLISSAEDIKQAVDFLTARGTEEIP